MARPEDKSKSPILTRRQLGVATAVAGLLAILGRRPSFADGMNTDEIISLGLDVNEINAVSTLTREHDQETHALAQRHFNQNLVKKYGVTVEPADGKILKRFSAQSHSPLQDYLISSEIKISSVEAINAWAFSKYTRNGRLIDRAFVVLLSTGDSIYGGRSYKIPELSEFGAPMARGPYVLLDADFDKAVKAAFEIPDPLNWVDNIETSDGISQKNGEFRTNQGELVTYSANSKGFLFLTIEPPKF